MLPHCEDNGSWSMSVPMVHWNSLLGTRFMMRRNRWPSVPSPSLARAGPPFHTPNAPQSTGTPPTENTSSSAMGATRLSSHSLCTSFCQTSPAAQIFALRTVGGRRRSSRSCLSGLRSASLTLPVDRDAAQRLPATPSGGSVGTTCSTVRLSAVPTSSPS